MTAGTIVVIGADPVEGADDPGPAIDTDGSPALYAAAGARLWWSSVALVGPGPHHIPESWLPAPATCIVGGVSTPGFWDALASRRARLGAVLWDVADTTDVLHWPEVRARIADVTIVSMSLVVAERLLASRHPIAIVHRLLDAGAPTVVLRLGGEGALVADSRQRLHVGPAPGRVVNARGGGHGHAGGFLAGWCLGSGDLAYAGRCGAVAAARTVARTGPAEPHDRQGLQALAEAVRVVPHESSEAKPPHA